MRILLCLLLAGCSTGFSKDGTTVVSYCLLGGVYMDDSRVERDAEYKETTQCL